LDLTSQPFEMLLSVTRDGRRTLGAQIEGQIRDAIRARTLAPGARVPSTRDLARQLRVSRPVVVDAYAQLAAEGYLTLRQGAHPRVSDGAAPGKQPVAEPARPTLPPRFDFRPSVPDLAAFPRSAWLRSVRAALGVMADADLDYGDPRGVEPLRSALAEYLGRVRGVVTDPAHIVITGGYAQARGLICRALVAAGAKRIAIEDPSHPEQRATIAHAGLEVVPVPVDESGIRVEALEQAAVDAVVLTPAHQFPTGAVLAGERRTALLAWLRSRGAIAIEDDYDAEYRYDRAPVAALQGLEPDHVVYAGTASKTLAPALRIGWLAVPDSLLDAVSHEKRIADLGCPSIDQHAFAHFLTRGDLDRHLRRMRTRYRARRDTLVDALAHAVPEAEIQGIAAGLHAAVRLPETDDEQAILDHARRHRVAFTTMGEYRERPYDSPPTLLLGYAQSPEPTIRSGVIEIAKAVRAARGPSIPGTHR
jgi:GntR family transcriptional regulator/MocR family aminotransferase